MSTILTSETSWYNPFACNGKEISAIHILKDGEIFRSTNWFDYSNQAFKRVEFPFETKIKRNIDLNSKVAFLASSKNCLNERKWYLYIPIELLDDVEIEDEKSRNFGDMQTEYFTKMSFTLPKYVVKHPDVPWCPKNGRVSITARRYEDNELAKRCKKLAKIAKDNRVNVSYYDIKNLLKVFNISVKRQKVGVE